MKIGIISDTHDHHQNVLKAIGIFNDEQVKYVLHAGDMVSPFTAKAFANVPGARFIAVFGNCDGEKLRLKEAITEFGGEINNHIYTGRLDNKEIFMTHRPDMIDELSAGGKYDLLIFGHTHKQDIRKVGRSLIINPGETTDWITGQPSIVVLELDDMSYTSISL
jgi:putative phosphoesterase